MLKLRRLNEQLASVMQWYVSGISCKVVYIKLKPAQFCVMLT